MSRNGRFPVLHGYGRILVPVVPGPESERAVEVACRLASERGGTVTIVTVIEIPPVLPLDAHMKEEEADARVLLDRAQAVADSYGVTAAPRLLRGREPGQAIVEETTRNGVEVVVLGAMRRRVGTRIFGDTVLDVLKGAACRVLVVGPNGRAPALP